MLSMLFGMSGELGRDIAGQAVMIFLGSQYRRWERDL